MKKRIVTLLLAVVLLISLLVTGVAAAETGTFNDIGDKYYAHMIEDLAKAGIMLGTGNGKFSPDAPVTRAMAVTVLARLAGAEEKESTQFSDVVSGSWYAGYVGWAADNEIVIGDGEGYFFPDAVVTGEQMDLMLERYAKVAGFKYEPIIHSQTGLTRGELAVMIYYIYAKPQLPIPTTYSIEVEFDDMFGPQPATLSINISTEQWALTWVNPYTEAEAGGWYDSTTFEAEITNDGGQGDYMPKDAIIEAVIAGIKQIYVENNIPRPVYSTEVEFDDMFGPQPATLTINTKTEQWTLTWVNPYTEAEVGGWYDSATFEVEITNDGGQGDYMPKDAIIEAVIAGIKQIHKDNNISSSSSQGDHIHKWNSKGICNVCGVECSHTYVNSKCSTCGIACPHKDHDPETAWCSDCNTQGYHGYDQFVDGKYVCYCGLTSLFAHWNVPEEYLTDVVPEQQGKLEDITYTTYTYAAEAAGGKLVSFEKQARVYLPAGYDPSKQYDIYYLMHGGESGENQLIAWTLWFGAANGNIKPILDNMIANGEIEPMIVVTPTFYNNGAEGGNDGNLPGSFWQEFRNDLVPAVENKYSTYANGDTSLESLHASRAHRAYSGLSMGSMTGWQSILLHCTDIVGYVGNFSAEPNAPGLTDEEIIDAINTQLDKTGDKMYYWFNGNGMQDSSHGDATKPGHIAAYKYMISTSTHFKEGVNACFVDMPVGGHNWVAWPVHFYDTLKVFFKVDEKGEAPALDDLIEAGTLY